MACRGSADALVRRGRTWWAIAMLYGEGASAAGETPALPGDVNGDGARLHKTNARG
jgi:hypothetical protein